MLLSVAGIQFFPEFAVPGVIVGFILILFAIMIAVQCQDPGIFWKTIKVCT